MPLFFCLGMQKSSMEAEKKKMSITIFVKTRGGVHNVEVSGEETVGKLYTKAACAARLREPRFNLIWEGNVLDRNGDETVQGSGFMEGSVVRLEERNETVTLRELNENPERVAELERLLSADPEMILEVDVGHKYVTLVFMRKTDLPSGLRRLVVTDSLGRVAALGDNFLFGCELTSVTISLPNLTSIGRYFLNKCDHLRIVDLTRLINIPRGTLQVLLAPACNWRPVIVKF
eukprot:TRINITY_DN3585_c1_g1_i1.p2 TRINITY_DN3585_c1_g1~~TRINITY_DN3585_c1_g1_i1.p2  ORF type:complete len:232 (+),score=45.27 TRINITY_DN3585_c1_g1_i1:886-1581(+)